MNVYLDELEAVVEGATPGPWDVGHVPFPHHVNSVDERVGIATCPGYPAQIDAGDKPTRRGENDAAHIATFDPSTVSALLRVVRAAEEVDHEWTESVDREDEHSGDCPLCSALGSLNEHLWEAKDD